MSKCSCNECDLEVFENNNRCIFHCEKDNWITKYDPSSDEFDLGTEVIYFWDEEKVKKFWKKFKEVIEEQKDLFEKDSYYRFYGFIFPKMEQDTFKDYTFDCDLVFTEKCSFEGDINFFQTIFNRQIYFNDCKIKGKVSFGKSIFKDRFTFNNIKEIKEVFFKHAEFKEKVEFKESWCEKVDFENTTFEKLADFKNTTFAKSINFEKTTFRDISVFTNVTFKNDVDFKYTTFEKLAQFKEAIFEKRLNLEDSIIKEKINFLKIKTKNNKELNSFNMANRETARIIKDSFEQQNNIIEANKFYALEMKEREKELEEDIKKGKNFFEWLVFKIHGLASNHSQDWILALFWIISLTFLTSFIKTIDSNFSQTIEKIGLSFILISIIFFININISNSKKLYYLICGLVYYLIYAVFTKDFSLTIFSNLINPFSIMTGKEELNFGILLYKITIAYLIYQLIISIRQNTRRK